MGSERKSEQVLLFHRLIGTGLSKRLGGRVLRNQLAYHIALAHTYWVRSHENSWRAYVFIVFAIYVQKNRYLLLYTPNMISYQFVIEINAIISRWTYFHRHFRTKHDGRGGQLMQMWLPVDSSSPWWLQILQTCTLSSKNPIWMIMLLYIAEHSDALRVFLRLVRICRSEFT